MKPSKTTQALAEVHDKLRMEHVLHAINPNAIVAMSNYAIALQLSRIADALEVTVTPKVTMTTDFVTEFKVPNATGKPPLFQTGGDYTEK